MEKLEENLESESAEKHTQISRISRPLSVFVDDKWFMQKGKDYLQPPSPLLSLHKEEVITLL